MAYTIQKMEKWTGAITDQPGGLDEKLGALAEAGANLEFVLARRSLDQAGQGEVFLAPVKGARLIKAAQKAGLRKAEGLFSLRVEGPDKPGLAHRTIQPLAAEGINLKGFIALSGNRKCTMILAFDNADDMARAMRVL